MITFLSRRITNYINNKNIICNEKYTCVDKIIQQIISIIIILSFIIILGIKLDCLLEVFVITIVSNILRQFSGGIHFNINFCTIFSIVFIIILSWISKNTYQHSFQIFLITTSFTILSIFIIPNISQKDKTHDDDYYRNGFIFIFFIMYLIQIGCIYLDLFRVLNSINYGFISVLLTLTSIKNIKERVNLIMPYGKRKKSGEKNE